MSDTTKTNPCDPITAKSVRDLLIEGPLTEARVIEIGIQVAAALEALAGGVGKLALEVISICEDRVELDFGASGAATLLAPEVLSKGISQDDQRAMQLADVWSLGVLLYLLLAGHSPFGGITRKQQIKAITAPRPTPDIRNVRPEVSDDLAGLLYHMLQRNVEYRSRVPNVETVRRTLESIQREVEIPYSIPEFPVVEAKAILKDAHHRKEKSRALSESEYQLVRRLVDSGQLQIDAEYKPLWRRSRWLALGRRLGARLIGSWVLGISAGLVSLFGNIAFGNPNATAASLIEEAIGTMFVAMVLNGASVAIITITSHISKLARPAWWGLPAVMTVLTGLILMQFEMFGLTHLYDSSLQAFMVGAAAGLIIGSVYTISMPSIRQDTILKQSQRPMIISGIVGLIYGVLFLVTQFDAAMTFYTLASSLIGVPMLIVSLLMSFVLGVELGDRYIER